MQMHMVMCIHVVQRESRLSKRFKLRAYFRFKLPPDVGVKEKPETRPREMGRKRSGCIHQIWNLPRGQDGSAFHQRQMEPDPERRESFRPFYGIPGKFGADHQACSGQNTLLVRFLDRRIDRQGQAEIVSGNNDSFQGALRAAAASGLIRNSSFVIRNRVLGHQAPVSG